MKREVSQSSMVVHSESGQLTLDFLFAVVLICSTAALVSVLCIGLTLAEVLQYVAFSGSRAYYAGDNNQSAQTSAADSQVKSLVSGLPFLSAASKNGWISLTRMEAQDYGNYAESKGASQSEYPDKFQYIGYQIDVTFSLLTFKFPLEFPPLSSNASIQLSA